MAESRDIHTDENMENLMGAINAVPGAHALAGCGGHEFPEPGQLAAGAFMAMVKFDPNEEGWMAMAFVARAVGRCPGAYRPGGMMIQVRYTVDETGDTEAQDICFAVIGLSPITPNLLAAEIIYLLDKQN